MKFETVDMNEINRVLQRVGELGKLHKIDANQLEGYGIVDAGAVMHQFLQDLSQMQIYAVPLQGPVTSEKITNASDIGNKGAEWLLFDRFAVSIKNLEGTYHVIA